MGWSCVAGVPVAPARSRLLACALHAAAGNDLRARVASWHRVRQQDSRTWPAHSPVHPGDLRVDNRRCAARAAVRFRAGYVRLELAGHSHGNRPGLLRYRGGAGDDDRVWCLRRTRDLAGSDVLDYYSGDIGGVITGHTLGISA